MKETISLNEAATANLELGNALITLAKNNPEEWYYRTKGENILFIDYNREDIYLLARYSFVIKELAHVCLHEGRIVLHFFFSLLHFICI